MALAPGLRILLAPPTKPDGKRSIAVSPSTQSLAPSAAVEVATVFQKVGNEVAGEQNAEVVSVVATVKGRQVELIEFGKGSPYSSEKMHCKPY